MKTVYLDGKRVVVAGFASKGEVEAAKETIKGNWPCCERRISYKPDITAIIVAAPTLIVAHEILETMSRLFTPITA